MTERVIDDTFVVYKALGQGFTSSVVLAEHRDTGYKLAIKIFKPLKQMKLMVENFRKEVDAMKNLKHDNLINIIAANENGIFMNKGKKEGIMYLGVELAENAELFDFIADPGVGFNENIARALFKQLINGLSSMHELKVAHRDLKTENLFLDKNFNLKIGDFGFAKFMDPNSHEEKLKTQLGTSGYQCPELIENQYYSGEANDIFACGVILFILCNAYPPFKEAKKTDTWYRHLYYDKEDAFWAYHNKKVNNSKELKELITGMLRNKNRYTMNDIKSHPWFNGELPSKEEYVNDMILRKKKVDERRERERLERLEAEGSGNSIGSYRGEDEEVMIDQFYKQLENDNVDNFPRNFWEGDLPKNFFRFNGTNLKEIYKFLISILVNEGGKLELDKEKYTLYAEVPFTSAEQEEETIEQTEIATINFQANLYIDEESKSTLVVVLKDNFTDNHEFKKFLAYITDKAKN